MKQFLIALCVASAGLIQSCSKDDPAPAPDPNIIFKATLNGSSEVPANSSAATGTATLTFNNTTKVFYVTVNYSGMTATAAHIHKGAIGVSGGVIFGFSSAAAPITYTSAALDLAQEADLKANLYYVNLHSVTYGGGEIRGQLIKQ